jgi:hypothetical protein
MGADSVAARRITPPLDEPSPICLSIRQMAFCASKAPADLRAGLCRL